MKVGTDGVLLGAWADAGHAKHILDAGTGSGLIALMMAQRSDAFVDAVEIDVDAASQAKENVALSPWNDRICIHTTSFQHFSEMTPKKYDLVVSNPPFFRNSLKPPAGKKSMAKHDVDLSYDDLLSGSARLLNDHGNLCIIIPAADQDHFCILADFYGLSLSKVTSVQPYPHKEPVRCLAEFSKQKHIPCTENSLTIRISPEIFSEEYKKLTKEFYQAF